MAGLNNFKDPEKIAALALAIIPDDPGCTAKQKEALDQARENMKDNLLTKLGEFINDGLNDIFTDGVPAPSDGGLALQTAWKAKTLPDI